MNHNLSSLPAPYSAGSFFASIILSIVACSCTKAMPVFDFHARMEFTIGSGACKLLMAALFCYFKPY